MERAAVIRIQLDEIDRILTEDRKHVCKLGMGLAVIGGTAAGCNALGSGCVGCT